MLEAAYRKEPIKSIDSAQRKSNMIVKAWNIHWKSVLCIFTHLSLEPRFCYWMHRYGLFLFHFVPGGITRVKICRWLYPKTHKCFVPMNDWQWNNKNTSLNKAWAFLRSRVCPLSVAIVKTLFGGFSRNSKQKLKYSISYTLENLSLSLSFPSSSPSLVWREPLGEG